MLIKLISIILSAVMTAFSFPVHTAEAIFSSFTGVPYTHDSINEDFISDIDYNDVQLKNGNAGYYKNMMVVFIDDDATVFEKYDILKKNNLKLLGWCCWADLYFVYCPFAGEKEINALAKKIVDSSPYVNFAGSVPFAESTPDYTPDDPFSGSTVWNESVPSGDNWHLEAVKARESWNYSDYTDSIKVGIIDNGFRLDNPDIAGKVRFLSKLSEKRNSVEYHGTHVAGVIGAEHNNKFGVSGMCNKADMMVVVWVPTDSQKGNTTIHIFFAFCKLVKAGAKVINLSVGTSGNVDQNTMGKLEMESYALIYSAIFSVFLSEGYDFVVVQSAGNGDDDGNSVDSYYNGHFCPINEKNCNSVAFGISKKDILDRILVVGAVRYNSYSREYTFTSFSNTGKGVNICAPGSSVCGIDSESDGIRYMSGTSASAPIVAGTAALVWSVNPSLSGSDIKNILINNVSDYASSEYEESDRKYPMVNAKLAVEAALSAGYKTVHLTGTVDSSCNMQEDGVEIINNGKRKNITAPNGNIDLLIEIGDVTINVLGSDNQVVKSIELKSVNSDYSLGRILPDVHENVPE